MTPLITGQKDPCYEAVGAPESTKILIGLPCINPLIDMDLVEETPETAAKDNVRNN